MAERSMFRHRSRESRTVSDRMLRAALSARIGQCGPKRPAERANFVTGVRHGERRHHRHRFRDLAARVLPLHRGRAARDAVLRELGSAIQE